MSHKLMRAFTITKSTFCLPQTFTNHSDSEEKNENIFFVKSDGVLFLLPNHLYMVQKYISNVGGKGFMLSLAVQPLPFTYLIFSP